MGRDLRGFEFIKDEKVNICTYVHMFAMYLRAA